MVEYVKMDKQGRITIPAQIRNLLSISENNILELDCQANQIIIRKGTTTDLEEIEKWFTKISNMEIIASPTKDEIEDSKWYSEDYVRQKLGI